MSEGPKLLLDAFVPGRPIPKGSMDFMPNGRAVQNNAASTPWQRDMEAAFRRHTSNRDPRPGRWDPRPGYPHNGPVVIFAEFYFAKPKHPEFEVPASSSTGDLDKLSRNLLDALEEAKVYTNDTRVVDLYASTRFAGERTKPGVQVWVYGLEHEIVSARTLRGTWLMLQRATERSEMLDRASDAIEAGVDPVDALAELDPFALPTAEPVRKLKDVGPIWIAAYDGGSCSECGEEIVEGTECRYVEGEIVRVECCGVDL